MKRMKVMSIKLLCVISLIGFMACETTEIVDEMIEAENSIETESRPGPLVFDGNCDYAITDLIAGQNMVVGTVEVTVVGGNYMITYSVIEGWCITETHLDVAEAPEDFPMTRSGNPQNGHFEYSNSHDCVFTFTYEVPTSEGTYIAAHAVVNCFSDPIEDLENSLPEMVNACTLEKGVDAVDSYFNIVINDSYLAGEYDAWCVDQDLSLEANECFVAAVYSSYETLPDGAFEQPENFDLVNWVLNQNFIGMDSGGDGVYTFGDVQRAIWDLVDNSNCVDCVFLGDWSQLRADAIFDAAEANGEGFVPDCGEMVAIILIPDNSRQSVIFPIPLECQDDCEETAWGEGCGFPGRNWAMYFHYNE